MSSGTNAHADKHNPADGPRVRVLIPAYEGREALCRSVESVLAAGCSDLRVLVVDDASGDGSADEIRHRFENVDLIVNAQNQGFASACNTGFRRALEEGAELVLLLNQDTLVSAELPQALVRFMDEHPLAGIVGPKTFSFDPMPDGRPRLIYAGSWQRWLPLLQRIPGINRAEDDPASEPIQVDYVWGHGMMIRTEALRATGGFDASFPMYYEDLDLCRRMRTAGWEIWCDPRAVMSHDQPDGARALESEYWRWACKVRSMGVFHRKHYGYLSSKALGVLTVAHELQQLLRHGHGRAARHLMRATWRYAFGLRDELRPSSEIAAS